MRNVALLAVVVGCYREPASPPQVPSNKVERQRPAEVDDELAFLPKDAEMVVGLDFVRMRQSALFKTFESQIQTRFDRELRRMQSCGFDPLRSLTHITLAGSKDNPAAPTNGVIVVRGVDGALARACLEQAAQNDVTLKLDGNVATAKLGDGNMLVMTMVNPSTVVVVAAPHATRATLERVLASGAPLRESRVFMGLFAQRERDAGLWFMVNGNAAFMSQFRAMGVSPQTIDGTLAASDKLTGVVRLGFGSEDEAAQLIATVTPMLASAQAMIERVDVRADGATARFDVAVTETQLQLLGTMLGGLIP
jgi:hypothetical protein